MICIIIEDYEMKYKGAYERDVFETRTATEVLETKSDVIRHRPEVTDVKTGLWPSELKLQKRKNIIYMSTKSLCRNVSVVFLR